MNNSSGAYRPVSSKTDPDLNPGSVVPESVFLTTVPFCATSNSEILKKKKRFVIFKEAVSTWHHF